MSAEGVKDFSDAFFVEETSPGGAAQQAPKAAQRETDPHRLAQRQKQIDLGKNTLGYQRYRQAVPRDQRNRRTDPFTPDVYQLCSKRAFEGQVKKWRRQLHAWDPREGAEGAEELPEDGGEPYSNPMPVEELSAEDFIPISHEDAAPDSSSTPAVPKNGERLRPVGNLPLKLPSAVRKRQYDETVACSENHQPQPYQHRRQQQHGGGQPREPRAPRQQQARGAKHQRRAETAVPMLVEKAHAMQPTPPASEPSWAEQRYAEPELDYGEEDCGWQMIDAEPEREQREQRGRSRTGRPVTTGGHTSHRHSYSHSHSTHRHSSHREYRR